ncbi:venom peptide SjAPI-like [Copidosoma floridanum]|uniref:venom peptide SjAPI-like n=1 Tax=Copidosoma floridanum TaxID=29053 RepID=UPI0006C9BEBD|nr:venom peptide SjAPI-like [Copidosoma floridanum]
MNKSIAVLFLLFVSINIIWAYASHRCPANQTFTESGSACPPRCNVRSVKAPARCLAISFEPKCRCNPGYIIKGNNCVKSKDC